MKTKISRYDIKCITKEVCEQDITCSETTETVAANGSYLAIKKAERALLKDPKWYHETVKYTMEARMAESDTRSAKSSPICTKSMLRHPKPRCVDFTGKVRYKHDWTQEKESRTDTTVAESLCTVCGMTKTVNKWGRHNSKSLRYEYKPDPDFLPHIGVYVSGLFVRKVGRHVQKIAKSQIHDIIKKAVQDCKITGVKTRNLSYYVEIPRGIKMAKGKAITLKLRYRSNPTLSIKIDGLEREKYSEPYCSLCRCQTKTGHTESQHEGEATPATDSKCHWCSNEPRYCCVCSKMIHWIYGCAKNKERHVNTDEKWYCGACINRLNLTEYL